MLPMHSNACRGCGNPCLSAMSPQLSLLRRLLSPMLACDITGSHNAVPATTRRVPHISLVFCEMWDTTVFDLECLLRTGSLRDRAGYPTSREKRARCGAPVE